jgi:hypothetical protein
MGLTCIKTSAEASNKLAFGSQRSGAGYCHWSSKKTSLKHGEELQVRAREQALRLASTKWIE